MNNPVACICSCIAGLGVLILACSTYYTVVYGHGDFEAGNFHRCVYSTERDAQTGRIHRSYDTRWELVSSTERSALAEMLDMWFVGLGFVVLGAGIYIGEWSSSGGQRFSY